MGKSQREKRKDTLTMKFLCSMAMLAIISISLTTAESGIISHQNDPLEIIEKTGEITGAESNSTRLSSPSHPEACYGNKASLAVRKAAEEAFRLYKGMYAILKHAFSVSPKGTKMIVYGPAGRGYSWFGYVNHIQCVNYKNYELYFIS